MMGSCLMNNRDFNVSMNDIYIIDTPENGSDMLPDDSTGLVCKVCGMLTKNDYINPAYHIPKRCPDISHTYDGFMIGSERFKQVTESNGFSGVQFVKLVANPSFYVVTLNQMVSMARVPDLKMEEYCATCDCHVSVWGKQVVEIPDNGIANTIYRSDLKMGYKLMMFPLWICNSVVEACLKSAGLKGFSFEKAKVKV